MSDSGAPCSTSAAVSASFCVRRPNLPSGSGSLAAPGCLKAFNEKPVLIWLWIDCTTAIRWLLPHLDAPAQQVLLRCISCCHDSLTYSGTIL